MRNNLISYSNDVGIWIFHVLNIKFLLADKRMNNYGILGADTVINDVDNQTQKVCSRNKLPGRLW